MGQCEVCGSSYEHVFQVVVHGHSHTFDSFECAIHALAPKCAHCQCRVLGHGVNVGDEICCCDHCARQLGEGHGLAPAPRPDNGRGSAP
jgi:hypothetical protein